MLYRKWSKRCREATHEKDVLKTRHNLSADMSSLKDLFGAIGPNFPKYEFSKAKNYLSEEEILREVKKFIPQCLSCPFRPLICVCTKNGENVNGWAILVIVVVEH